MTLIKTNALTMALIHNPIVKYDIKKGAKINILNTRDIKTNSMWSRD